MRFGKHPGPKSLALLPVHLVKLMGCVQEQKWPWGIPPFPVKQGQPKPETGLTEPTGALHKWLSCSCLGKDLDVFFPTPAWCRGEESALAFI